MSKNISITLKNVSVSGVDTLGRVSSIKSILFGKKSLNDVWAKEIKILENINFSATAGDVIGVIGRNGSGKSSLLKVIAGNYPIKSGECKVVGEVLPLVEMGLGFHQELSGRDNIRLSMLYTNKGVGYSKELEQEIIAFAELEEKIDQPLKIYSSGMKARLSFAIAALQDSDILILDEVFATGDMKFREKSYKFLSKRIKEVPITLMVNHSEVVNCNRAIVLEQGKIVNEGSPKEMLKFYKKEILGVK